MPLAAIPAAIIGGAIAGGGSIAAGALGAHAAGQAAHTQAQAADQAAALQSQSAQNSLGFQQGVYNNQQIEQRPFVQAGQNAVMSLNQLLGLGRINPRNPNPDAPGLVKPPITSGPQIQGLWKGGRARSGGKYLVGEKGPEVLVMHPGSSGTVIPNSQVGNLADLQGRAVGGMVQGRVPNTGGVNFGNLGNPSPSPVASTGARPAAQPGYAGFGSNPYGAQANNPLITGGSNRPIQSTPFTQFSQQFHAPTMQQAANEPGYQFALQQGENAILNNASALGTTGSGATGAALQNYGQQAAQQDYQNVYNRALGQYKQNYDIFSNNQSNQFNRLASLSGLGQTGVGQLGSAGQAAAGNVAGIYGNLGQQVGQNINNAGAANASGYVGGANAWGGALNNLGQLGQLAYLYQNQQPQGYLSDAQMQAGIPGVVG